MNEEQKEAIENFQRRLTKAEHPLQNGLYSRSLKEEPNLEYELLRRRIQANTKEFWNYVRSSLLDVQKKAAPASETVDIIEQMLLLGAEHQR